MAKKVLITGARAAAALDVARDFAADGWEVHLADCLTARVARWSRVPARHHYYPPPRQQGAAFRARIADLVEEHDFALVVPTCEEVFHLAAPSLHQQLGVRLFAPNLAMLRRLHDKRAFAGACNDWGLSAPETHSIESRGDLAPFQAASREWVFKPQFSRFGDCALIAPNAAELSHIEPSPMRPWIAQRCIRGEEVCFHAIAYHGRLTGFAAYRSDWRLGGGARYAFEPLVQRRHLCLHDIAAQLALRGGLHGQFACDVMFDALDIPYLLECNPRATSGVHLLSGNGALAQAISQGTPMPKATGSRAYLAPAMWLFGLPLALRKRRLAEWRALLATGTDAISRVGDRTPIAGALVDAARFFATGLRHGISTNAATTFDIEWNGEEME